MKIHYLVAIFIFIVIGCANIPKSEYPVQIEREFDVSFDETWNAVLEVVKIVNGNIIETDKSSGLIVYSTRDIKPESQTYINVYLKSNPTSKATLVYFNPKASTGLYLKEIDKDFFEKVKGIIER